MEEFMPVIFDPLISSIKVIDLSIPPQEAQNVALDTALSGVFPVFCSKGKDNVITENKSASTISARYGDDFNSFPKWGQANITAMGLVRSKGRSFICRLLPTDATRAYAVFGVYVSEEVPIVQFERNDTVYSPDRTSVISYGTASYKLTQDGQKIPMAIKSSPGAENPDMTVELPGVRLRLGTKQLDLADFDENQYPVNYNADVATIGNEKFFPLFSFSYYGRGKGGQAFGFNIIRDTGRDKALHDGRRYYMTCYERLSTGGLSALYPEPFYFSFNPDAMFSSESNVQEGLSAVYINTDDNDEELPLQMSVYDENYLKLVTELSTYKDISETIHDIDFINCIFKNGNPYGRIIKSQDTIDMMNSIVTLEGGSDGSLDATNDQSEIERIRNELRIKFFKFEIDETLLDEKICDIDIAPDCNYAPDVKKCMLRDFHPYRWDIKMLMDVGITKSYREASNIWTEYIPFIYTEAAYMVSVNAHSGLLRDPSIPSPYPVTYTYDYIRGLADNFGTTGGAFQMHAGSNRGKVKYFKPYWFAQKSLSNMFEVLENLGLNYIQRIDKRNNFMYGSEYTQYMVGGRSKLISDRNSLIVGRAIRICHGVLINYKYDERDIKDTMIAAQKNIRDELTRSDIPKTVKIDVLVYQTKEDKRNENAHCDIIFRFPDYSKGFGVTIYALRPESELPPAIAERLAA
jgi:hypothetical protein